MPPKKKAKLTPEGEAVKSRSELTVNDFPAELSTALREALKKGGVKFTTGYEQVPRLSSGSVILDYGLGGGWPKGRVSIIWGNPSEGKTTTALMTAAAICNNPNPSSYPNGGRVLFIDAEHAYDPQWGQRLGIDRRRFHIYEPPIAEVGLDVVIAAAGSGDYDLIIWDSIAGSLFQAVAEGDMSDNHVGVAARKWSQFYPKVIAPLKKTGTTLILINQVREKVGVMYGSPETMSGGKAHRFFASVVLRTKAPDEDDEFITFNMKTTKNKTAPPNREFSVRVAKNASPMVADVVYEAVELGKELGIFTREDGSPISGNGSWFYRGEKFSGGRNQTEDKLRDDPEVLMNVLTSIEDYVANLNRAADPQDEVEELPPDEEANE